MQGDARPSVRFALCVVMLRLCTADNSSVVDMASSAEAGIGLRNLTEVAGLDSAFEISQPVTVVRQSGSLRGSTLAAVPVNITAGFGTEASDDAEELASAFGISQPATVVHQSTGLGESTLGAVSVNATLEAEAEAGPLHSLNVWCVCQPHAMEKVCAGMYYTFHHCHPLCHAKCHDMHLRYSGCHGSFAIRAWKRLHWTWSDCPDSPMASR